MIKNLTPYPETGTKITRQAAKTSNALMLDIAQNIVVGHIMPEGLLSELLKVQSFQTI